MNFDRFKHFWVDPNHPHFTLSTSGSTGEPKPVLLPKEGLKWSAHNTNKVLKLSQIPHAKLLCCIPTHKIGGVMMWVRAVELGLQIETHAPQADPMKDLPRSHDFNIVSLVPYQLQTILQNPESVNKLNQFNLVLVGGAALNGSLQKAILNLKPRFYLSYGMTETFSHIALQALNGPQKQDFFELMPDCEIQVNDQNNLLVKTPFTQGSFLQTQDQAQWVSPNSFVILGRSDFVINSGGIKLFPEEIESAISALQVIEPHIDWLISSAPHPALGEQVVLVSSLPIEPSLKAEIMKPLPTYYKPKLFVVLEAIPRTQTGKLMRNLVKEKLSIQL